MQENKIDYKNCDFMKVPLRDFYKAYDGKRNLQHGFQEEDYVKQLVLNFKALKYQAILTYMGQAESMNVPKESKKVELRSLFPQNGKKKKKRTIMRFPNRILCER